MQLTYFDLDTSLSNLNKGTVVLGHIYFLDFRNFMRFIGNKNKRMAGIVGELSRHQRGCMR